MKWHFRIVFFNSAIVNDAKLSCVGIATKIHHVALQYSTASSLNIGIFLVFEIQIFGRSFLNTKNKFSFHIPVSFLILII